MLKSDLLLKINSKYSSLSISDIELVTDLFFKKIVDGLLNNKKVELRRFGTITKKINKAKYVRNPKTNENIYKEQSYKVHFKIGKTMHQRINSDLNNNE